MGATTTSVALHVSDVGSTARSKSLGGKVSSFLLTNFGVEFGSVEVGNDFLDGRNGTVPRR